MEALYGCAPFWERLFGAYLCTAERATCALAWPLLRRRAPSCGARPRSMPALEKDRAVLEALLTYGMTIGTPAFLPWLWCGSSNAVRYGYLGVYKWSMQAVSGRVGARGDVAVAEVWIRRCGLGKSAVSHVMEAAAQHDHAPLVDWCLAEEGVLFQREAVVRTRCLGNVACASDAVNAFRVLMERSKYPVPHTHYLELALAHGATRVLTYLADERPRNEHARVLTRISPVHDTMVMVLLMWCAGRADSIAWLATRYDVLAAAQSVVAAAADSATLRVARRYLADDGVGGAVNAAALI